ncbi:MAG: hypothetical protein N3F07_01130 [Candidatus Micrarchaeota archaeon]|nr:hypothetical protein [Candidatus Micrarchaeota archaeon]
MRAQISLEALASLAALLAGIGALAFAANQLSLPFLESVRSASISNSLSYSALCIDTAAYSLQGGRAELKHSVAIVLEGESARVALGNRSLPLLRKATYSPKGGFHVQSPSRQPV